MAAIRTSYDLSEIDTDAVIEALRLAPGGAGRDPVDIRLSLAGSHCVALLDGYRQVAFARAISDGVFTAMVLDVFVAPDWRGQGLGRRVLRDLLAHPRLREVPCWYLDGQAAPEFFARQGFGRDGTAALMRLERD